MQYSFEPFPVLYTERLCLRAVQAEDAEAYFALRGNADVAKILCRKPYTDFAQAVERVTMLQKQVQQHQSITWSVTLADTGEIIGSVCLWAFDETNNTVELGYEFLPVWQGKGYAREAAKAAVEYGLAAMQAGAVTGFPPKENPRSIALLEALGFQRIGTCTDPGQNGEDLVLWVYRYAKK